ncbi:MAG: cation acetate symporter [Planctomycetales bacterium]|nr:cation acetate symporter [Planctomycetales bacterium]
MSGETSLLAVTIFFAFVGLTLGLSFYLGRKAKSSSGYFAAHGQIPWFVNGVAFAGDYLSAASFLGICGMIAFYGYDGFLYSIGYLAGWIVALFVIAEPMKRLGKFTFADALNSRFQSRGIQLAAGLSTLAVSIFYLIPQMVGAGVLVQPLLGFDHWVGVVLVGTVVILIVVTAGMVSTTWVQFIKGSLLVVFSFILTIAILQRGLETADGGTDEYKFTQLHLSASTPLEEQLQKIGFEILPADSAWTERPYVRVEKLGNPDGGHQPLLFRQTADGDDLLLSECQEIRVASDGKRWINGVEETTVKDGETSVATLHPVGFISKLPEGQSETGSLGPIAFLNTLGESEVVLWGSEAIKSSDGSSSTVYFPKPTPGSHVLRPGEHPKFAGIRKEAFWPKLDFLSLMIALFCGTASLPHILIRYYTVKDASAARKSTIVGIATIGFFYILTLYLGLGAMTSGAMDVTNSNMAAPLLARSISELLFATISAIAFTTVLGTVSGLILASAGAVSHDILKNFIGLEMNDHEQVRIAKIASVVVGIIAIALGILFEKMNVSYLVGWAFSVAASANLPALVMLLFWQRTTKEGIIAAVIVGMVSSLGWILLSSDTFSQVYGLARPTWLQTIVPFSQPGIVTIPVSFLTLVIVSLATQRSSKPAIR